jgi:hypothetical protein
MEKYKDGNSVKLVVKSDDEELIKVSKIFLKDIEERFNEFKDNYEKEFKKQNKYLGHGDFVFLPERLSKKSPLTLINAPWGTGKTYFIENFVKLFIDKKIKSDLFKKIIIIDAWKFSNSRDVPMEFVAELSNILVNLQTHAKDVETKKSLVKKLFGWMNPRNLKLKIGVKIVGLIDIYSDIERKVEEDTKEVEDNWKLIEDNKYSTIIFVDNIERLGSYTWDLLKSIIKLQEFSNYLIVLPLNIEKLANNSKAGANSEYPIEKYIDFNYYNFIQDFDGFFKTYIPNDKEWVDRLNLIFNSEVNNKKLSIREIESLFKRYKFFGLAKKYDQLALIYNNIWPAEETINNMIQQDVKMYFDYHKSISDVVKKVTDKLFIIDKNDNKYVNFIDEKFKSKLYSFERKENLLYHKDNDYIKIFKNISKELAKTFHYYESEIDRLKKDTIYKSKNDTYHREYEKYNIRPEVSITPGPTSNYFGLPEETKYWIKPAPLANFFKPDREQKKLDLFIDKLNRMTKNINEFIKDIEKIKSECKLDYDQIKRIDNLIEKELKFPKTLNDGDFEGYKKIDIRKFWNV